MSNSNRKLTREQLWTVWMGLRVEGEAFMCDGLRTTADAVAVAVEAEAMVEAVTAIVATEAVEHASAGLRVGIAVLETTADFRMMVQAVVTMEEVMEDMAAAVEVVAMTMMDTVVVGVIEEVTAADEAMCVTVGSGLEVAHTANRADLLIEKKCGDKFFAFFCV